MSTDISVQSSFSDNLASYFNGLTTFFLNPGKIAVDTTTAATKAAGDGVNTAIERGSELAQTVTRKAGNIGGSFLSGIFTPLYPLIILIIIGGVIYLLIRGRS